MEISRQLAGNVVTTSFQSLNKEVVQRAKWRILDAIGCAMAGVKAPGCEMMLNVVKEWGGKEECTVIGHGIKIPAPNAAMMNSLMTRSFDFEPIEAEGETKSSPAHISGTTIPTALAVAEKQGASGKDLVTALMIGDDLACRLGMASGFDFALGWCNTGTINQFGATAIAAKLLGLNEKQVFNAYGITLNQVAGSMAAVFDKTMAFKLPISFSSRNGIFSAELAKQGFVGVNEPFLGPRGFFALYCSKNHDTSGLVKDLGKRYYADVIIKPYSSCRATHPFIDCALQFVGNKDFKAEDIASVTIHTSKGMIDGFCGQPFLRGETPQVAGAFSIRFTVATTLLRKIVKPEFYKDEYILDPKIDVLIEKMELIGDIAPGKLPMVEMTIKMKSGKELKADLSFPKGDFRNTALTDEEIKAKFRSNVVYGGMVSKQNSEKAITLIDKLEDLKDVRELMKLLVKD
jgi:2-methylcitrate dehydratase PrpD